MGLGAAALWPGHPLPCLSWAHAMSGPAGRAGHILCGGPAFYQCQGDASKNVRLLGTLRLGCSLGHPGHCGCWILSLAPTLSHEDHGCPQKWPCPLGGSWVEHWTVLC